MMIVVHITKYDKSSILPHIHFYYHQFRTQIVLPLELENEKWMEIDHSPSFLSMIILTKISRNNKIGHAFYKQNDLFFLFLLKLFVIQQGSSIIGTCNSLVRMYVCCILLSRFLIKLLLCILFFQTTFFFFFSLVLFFVSNASIDFSFLLPPPLLLLLLLLLNIRFVRSFYVCCASGFFFSLLLHRRRSSALSFFLFLLDFVCVYIRFIFSLGIFSIHFFFSSYTM